MSEQQGDIACRLPPGGFEMVLVLTGQLLKLCIKPRFKTNKNIHQAKKHEKISISVFLLVSRDPAS
jgi:hypothetical protein